MRTVLRLALEGPTILALALFSATLHCALRCLRSQRAAAGASVPNRLASPAQRRPVFLSRGDLL
jgi:hypothetical protein